MSKEALIISAARIPAPNDATSHSLNVGAEEMARELTRKMNGQEDLENLIGRGNQLIMEMNHFNYFRYIASMATLFDPASFVETVIWVLRAHSSRGFTPLYWHVMLPEAKSVLLERLPAEQYHQVVVFHTWLHEHLNDFIQVSAETVSFYERISTFQGVLVNVKK